MWGGGHKCLIYTRFNKYKQDNFICIKEIKMYPPLHKRFKLSIQ